MHWTFRRARKARKVVPFITPFLTQPAADVDGLWPSRPCGGDGTGDGTGQVALMSASDEGAPVDLGGKA